MFTAYELAGVFTNLAAGMLGEPSCLAAFVIAWQSHVASSNSGARWGIQSTLLTGLTLQLVGIGVLYAWQTSWSEPGAQDCCLVGIASALRPLK